ncbi:VOC family protein [Spongiactinospora rosea]|uniref:VOC family protein n=1 Tax=Spongiactinospora rosea TaxID=2248750 RepID=UPI0018F5F04A
MPEAIPPAPQQFHLDISVPDLEQAARAAESAGATLLDDTHPWRIYPDPAGHHFCLPHEE